jgi:hypothetical protein
VKNKPHDGAASHAFIFELRRGYAVLGKVKVDIANLDIK